MTASLGLLLLMAGLPEGSKPPVLEMRELVLQTRAVPGHEAVHKRIRVAHPKGWTGERERHGRSIELRGPSGKILIAAALHPEGLSTYLAALKREHPAAAPSPPMAMKVPGIRTALGERATRFQITGKEVGEMVLIERNAAIVLIVTVVDPAAWPALSKTMERCYPTVSVTDVPQKKE